MILSILSELHRGLRCLSRLIPSPVSYTDLSILSELHPEVYTYSIQYEVYNFQFFLSCIETFEDGGGSRLRVDTAFQFFLSCICPRC
jgi:hypothetical protein